MSDNTRKLIAALADDPDTLERFKKDPESVMKEYDVPEDHQKMLLAGDKQGVVKAAGLDDSHADFIIV